MYWLCLWPTVAWVRVQWSDYCVHVIGSYRKRVSLVIWTSITVRCKDQHVHNDSWSLDMSTEIRIQFFSSGIVVSGLSRWLVFYRLQDQGQKVCYEGLEDITRNVQELDNTILTLMHQTRKQSVFSTKVNTWVVLRTSRVVLTSFENYRFVLLMAPINQVIHARFLLLTNYY